VSIHSLVPLRGTAQESPFPRWVGLLLVSESASADGTAGRPQPVLSLSKDSTCFLAQSREIRRCAFRPLIFFFSRILGVSVVKSSAFPFRESLRLPTFPPADYFRFFSPTIFLPFALHSALSLSLPLAPNGAATTAASRRGFCSLTTAALFPEATAFRPSAKHPLGDGFS